VKNPADIPARVEKTGEQSQANPFTFVLSTEDVDRVGDVVVQDGINLRNFKRNPVALFAHDHRRPIGVWENIRREGKSLVADLKLAAHGTSRFIDELRALIEQRILRATSIGFGVEKAEPLDPDNPRSGYRFVKTELHEASLVSVPANQFALRVKSLNISDDTARIVFADDGAPGRHARAASKSETSGATPAKVAPVVTQSPKGTHMNLADKIKAKQERLAAVRDRVAALKAIAENTDSDLTVEQEGELDALISEDSAIVKSMESLTKLESAIAEKAQPVQRVGYVAPFGGHAKQEPAGSLMAKMATANFFAHVERKTVDQVIAERYAQDQRVAAVQKTAVGIADTTTQGWAAELVRSDVYGFIDSLKSISVYAALASRGVGIDFGNAGSITVPKRTGNSSDLAGAFVGEAGVIPVKRTSLGGTPLNRYKMAVISTFTKELARVSTPQVETLIRQAMLDDTATALDVALLDGTISVPGVRPSSILAGVTGSAGAAGGDAAAVIADLKALITTLTTANAGRRPVLIMNTAQRLGLATVTIPTGGFLFRDELASGRVMGVEVIDSNHVAPGTVIIVDAADFATAFGTPEFDVSDTATLTMANADGVAPTQAGDAAGALGTPEQVLPDGGIHVAGSTGAAYQGYQAMSMFQQWSIAVRMVMPLSWSMLRTGVVDKKTGVTW
jgi:HK97 family phage major capsid protein/HK97 family phage prohead protease